MLVFSLRCRCAMETTVLLRDSLISLRGVRHTRRVRFAISGESSSEPSTLTAPVSHWTRAEISLRLPRTIPGGLIRRGGGGCLSVLQHKRPAAARANEKSCSLGSSAFEDSQRRQPLLSRASLAEQR